MEIEASAAPYRAALDPPASTASAIEAPSAPRDPPPPAQRVAGLFDTAVDPLSLIWSRTWSRTDFDNF